MIDSDYRYRHALARVAVCRVALSRLLAERQAGRPVDEDSLLAVAADLDLLERHIAVYERTGARSTAPSRDTVQEEHRLGHDAAAVRVVDEAERPQSTDGVDESL